MPCDTKLKPRQTISERVAEVRKAIIYIDKSLRRGQIKVLVDKKTGAIAFDGLTNGERDGVTDGCIYRRIMATGTASAKQAIARAELLAGRGVNKQAVAQGVHSHDGGKSWHHGH